MIYAQWALVALLFCLWVGVFVAMAWGFADLRVANIVAVFAFQYATLWAVPR